MILGHAGALTSRSAQWRSALERVTHDVYHTPEYHSLPGFGQTGEPQAFIYEEGPRAFLWPYLLTPIEGTGGWNDVTSVYGYPGPVGSPDGEFIGRAWIALLDHWRQQEVVSAFTRFHPLLGNCHLLAGIPQAMAGIRAHGSTVSIDLTLPMETQARHYNKTLRQEIRKAREAGLTTFEDEHWTFSDEFVSVYQETMARRGSRPEYLLDRAWVDRFRNTMGQRGRLFVTKSSDGAVAAAMIMLDYRPYIHSHLIGTAPAFAEHSPSKLLLDDVRIWGAQRGYQGMHLGGGLGGKRDALFEFKSRFSPLTHSFQTGSWILNERRYRELESQHRTRLAAQGIEVEDTGFFPAYRYLPHAPASK